ncbi:MAG TPA: 5-(carboxyamino)imidazole ribonucleotide synthase, partial [Bacteroidetes bacterium]|nr:5-(carboxyamino)imidazole ribonucleotide synthase [Bacteroidota bacterium]
MTKQIHPPAAIGIIGGGQLGMMVVREAQRMGYRSVVWDPDPDCPASRLADETITASFGDREAAGRLASAADVVTYEFENVDPEIVEWLEESKIVFPGSAILRIAQHRRSEKDRLQKRGFPTVTFQAVESRQELRSAIESIGLPVVVKSATAGYDGKGQTVLRTQEEAEALLGRTKEPLTECVVEQFIDLESELSVVAVRGKDGAVTSFPVCENVHRENILHTTTVPTHVAPAIQNKAIEIGRSIVESFNIVGVLCTEMFVTKEGNL